MPLLPLNPKLDHLRARAQELLPGLREKHPTASLADALDELARQHGFQSWEELKSEVELLSTTAEGLAGQVGAGWDEFRGAVSRIPDDAFDLHTSSGWSVKGMLAHVAFWEETVTPTINAILRGRPWPSRKEWHGGDAWDPSVPFPQVNHNAREAQWGDGHPPTEVLDRLDRAHDRVLEIVDGLTAEEAADLRYARTVATQTYLHYREHLTELRATVDDNSVTGP